MLMMTRMHPRQYVNNDSVYAVAVVAIAVASASALVVVDFMDASIRIRNTDVSVEEAEAVVVVVVVVMVMVVPCTNERGCTCLHSVFDFSIWISMFDFGYLFFHKCKRIIRMISQGLYILILLWL